MIRPSRADDFDRVWTIINDGASAYHGVIPADCWHEPYMTRDDLRNQLHAGVAFSVFEEAGEVIGVMGIQHVKDVTLIRHAYVRTTRRKSGIRGSLLLHLRTLTQRPVLIGTWAAAAWAIAFYEKHGFRLVAPAVRERLLREYWTISPRQLETSVVLADESAFRSVILR